MMILVTGATGSVGSHVCRMLVESGARVRALTRHPESVTNGEVHVVAGDLSQPDSIAGHLRDVSALYLVAMGGDPSIVELAERAGVGRVVLLSTGDVLDDVEKQPDLVAERHFAFEAAVERTSMSWTFLRPNEFDGNALHWAGQIAAGDVVRAPYGAAATAAIHEVDVASVAVKALLEDGHEGMKYALTGPETITHEQQVQLIGAALGRSLRFEELPALEFRASMVQYAPPAVVDAVLGQLERAVHEPHAPTGTVPELLGRPALSFAQWAEDHAEDFRTQ